MGNLGHQIPGVAQCRAETQFVGVELGQQATIFHKIKRALALADDRE